MFRNMPILAGDPEDRTSDSESQNGSHVCVVPMGRLYPSPDHLVGATVQGGVYKQQSTHPGGSSSEEIMSLHFPFPSVD